MRKISPPSPRDVQWISGSLRRKLTLFVVVLLTFVIGLFWVFSAVLLQPAYENSIRNSMSETLDAVERVLVTAYASNAPMVSTTVTAQGAYSEMSGEVVGLLQGAAQSGSLNLNERCLEIADTSTNNLLLWDYLEPRCYLHPSFETGVTAHGVIMEQNPNSELVGIIRQQVLETGSIYHIERGLIIMGRSVLGGSFSVVLTANMENIPQAVNVLRQMLLPLSLLLIVVSMLLAWVFSHWFTRPVIRLSAAAKEMAKGNYDVQVNDAGDDEIAELSHEFNIMAQEVKRSSEMQKEILANVSHDLRTPLTLIKGYAETVRDLTGDNPEKRTEQLNVIVDETDRLGALVGSVLELTRVASGNEKNERVRFDLTELCEEVAYRYEMSAQQMQYNFVFSGEERCEILADPAQVERALHNLLGNALKHVGEDGYIGFSVARTKHSTARVEITDHGSGIPEQELPQIFERYYRSRNNEGKPGTGLGLSITKALFEANEFKYGVDSEVGKGSVFWFEAGLLSY